MAVSRLLPSGGANDFNLNLGGPYTSVTLTKEYASGSYSITSGNNDTTLDIYAFNADGSSAGYTNTKSFTASKGFNKLVVLGGQTGDVLGFTYKTTYTTVDDNDEVLAGPVIESVSPSVMAKVNDTITVTGRNFASDVTVSFTGTGYSSTAAKNIVRSSATSLIVTRPDNFPVTASPFTITATNPGISNPIGSNSHILANSVTAGNAPVWSTAATLPSYTKNVAYSTTLVATDSSDAGSTITYSIVSGLPTGLSLSTAGVLSGTSTSSTPLTGIVVRATDSGGNYVDRTFTIPNTGPVWTTTGALTNATTGQAYSYTLLAPDDSGTTPTFGLVSGSLPTGLSLNSATGVISGTPTVGSNGTASSFVISATDANGVTTNSGTLTLYVLANLLTRFTTSGSWVAPSNQTVTLVLVGGGGAGGKYYGSNNVGGGGGGAGGVVETTLAVTQGTTYTYTIGSGGAAISGGGSSGGGLHGNKGTNTTFGSATAAIGGGGGNGNNVGDLNWPSGQGNGGSGGGAGEATSVGQGTSGQGNNGGTCSTQWIGGGGGGKTAAGGATSGTNTGTAGSGGAGGTYLTYSVGGGGGGGASSSANPGAGGAGGGGAGAKNSNGGNGTANTGGGGGGSDSVNNSGAGGSGCVIMQYLG